MKKLISLLLAILMIATSIPVISLPALAVANTSNKKITDYKVGDIIKFGTYPQSRVFDNSLISTLNAQQGDWVSYNYYVEGEQSDYMKYKDVTYNGEKYRAVTFTSNRPIDTMEVFSAEENYQYFNGYFADIIYWFKYEPLKWRVLDPATGLVLCESIIDSQDYYPNRNKRTINGKTVYANNWEYSTIRTWLNETFYNTAFTSQQQSAIASTTLNNDAYSTSYYQYNANSTSDKIYLLSWNDVLNTSYGFDSSHEYAVSRQVQGTDYAEAQGLVDADNYYLNNFDYDFEYNYIFKSPWFLRNAGEENWLVCHVSDDGCLVERSYVYVTGYGILPAFNFNLNSEIFQSIDDFILDDIVVEEVTTTHASLDWEDVSSAVSYNVYNGTTKLANVTSSDYTVKNLVKNKNYTITVAAVNSAGAESSKATVTFTTPALDLSMRDITVTNYNVETRVSTYRVMWFACAKTGDEIFKYRVVDSYGETRDVDYVLYTCEDTPNAFDVSASTKDGYTTVTWPAVENAKYYEVQTSVDPDNTKSWTTQAKTDATSAKLVLAPSTKMSIRVLAYDRTLSVTAYLAERDADGVYVAKAPHTGTRVVRLPGKVSAYYDYTTPAATITGTDNMSKTMAVLTAVQAINNTKAKKDDYNISGSRVMNSNIIKDNSKVEYLQKQLIGNKWDKKSMDLDAFLYIVDTDGELSKELESSLNEKQVFNLDFEGGYGSGTVTEDGVTKTASVRDVFDLITPKTSTAYLYNAVDVDSINNKVTNLKVIKSGDKTTISFDIPQEIATPTNPTASVHEGLTDSITASIGSMDEFGSSTQLKCGKTTYSVVINGYDTIESLIITSPYEFKMNMPLTDPEEETDFLSFKVKNMRLTCVYIGNIYTELSLTGENFSCPTCRNFNLIYKPEELPSTCLDYGYTDGLFCNICNKFVKGHDRIQGKHTIKQEIVENPTCITDGCKVFKCELCNDIIYDQNIPKDPGAHIFQNIAVPATCTQKGYEKTVCKLCGYISSVKEYPVFSHVDFDNDHICDDCGNPAALLIGNRYDSKNDFEYILYSDGVLEIRGSKISTISYLKNSSYDYRQNVKSVILSDGLELSASYLFAYCENIENVILPNDIEVIPDYTFLDCKSLKDIEIPDSVSVIGECAFAGTGLESIAVPENVENLTYYTFSNCKQLKEVTLNSNLIEIGTGTFYGCTALENIQLPESVKRISENAFSECTGLNKLIIKSKLCEIFEDENTVPDATVICSVHGAKARNYADSFYRTFEYIDAHNFITKINIPSSCTSVGQYYAVCSCGADQTNTSPALGHNFDVNNENNIELTPSTCTAKGTTLVKCTRCDATTIVPIDKKDHTPSSVVVENETHATCKTEGSYEKVVYCSSCKEVISREVVTVEKLPHTEMVIPAVEPSCTSTGLTEGKKCSVCNEILQSQEIISKLSHDFSVVKTGRIEPTCTENGSEIVYKCSTCDETSGGELIPASGHKSKKIPAVAPTCTTTGKTEGQKCSVCGEILKAQTVVPALGHNYSSVVTEPTCTAEGYTTHTCSVCLDTYKDSKTPALGHDFSVLIQDKVEPSCGDSGCEAFYGCSRCDETTGGDEIPATGHAEVTIPKVEPTCTETGLTEGEKCSVCGDILVAQTTIPASGHNYLDTITSPACITEGYTTHTCSVCGYSYIDTRVNAVGHDIVIDESKAATCTTTGLGVGVHCKNCDYRIAQEIISAKGHTSDSGTVTKEPTCMETGIKTYKCLDCGDLIKTETISASGHNYTSKVTAPTCTAEGFTTFTCSVCGESYVTDVTSKVTHTEQIIPSIPATCLTDGKTEGKKCSVCGLIIVPQSIVAKTGHVSDLGSVTTAATCTTTGIKIYKCITCGDVINTEIIEKLGHDYSVVKSPRVNPGCITTGKEEVKQCSRCNATTGGDIIPNLGHDIEIDMDASPAECTVPGNTESSYCTRCDYKVDSVLIPATGHNYSAWKTVKAATCSEAGSQERTCLNCGDKQTKSIAKTAHNLVAIPAVEPTCAAVGKTEGEKCSVCGIVIVAPIDVAKKAHTYKNVVTKATLTANGKITPTCSVCGAKKTATAIYLPKTFTLSATKATYTGKAIKPTVTVKDSKGNVIDAKYYTVTYADNTNVGIATVTIKFKTNYSGTKTLNFTIAPKQVTGLKSSSEATTSLKLTWTKVIGAKYYKVEQSTDGKTWTVIAKANTTNSLTVSKLKAGTKYQFRVTALDSTKKIAGKASAVLKTGTLTTAPTIKLTSTKKATATVTITKVTGATKYIVYKSTDNKKWTKVADTTKLTYDLTKLTAGKKIYVKVVAVNAYGKSSAYSKVASVTVKK